MNRRRGGRAHRGRSTSRGRGRPTVPVKKKPARHKKLKPTAQEEEMEFSKASGHDASTKGVMKEGYSSGFSKAPKKITAAAISKAGEAARSMIEQLATPGTEGGKASRAVKKAPAKMTKQSAPVVKDIPKQGSTQSGTRLKERSGSISKQYFKASAPRDTSVDKLDRGARDSDGTAQKRKASIATVKKQPVRKSSGQVDADEGIKQRKASTASTSSVASKMSVSDVDIVGQDRQERASKATRRDSKVRKDSSVTQQHPEEEFIEHRASNLITDEGKSTSSKQSIQDSRISRAPAVSAPTVADKSGSKTAAEEVVLQKFVKSLWKKFSEAGSLDNIGVLLGEPELEDESDGNAKPSDEVNKDTEALTGGTTESADAKGARTGGVSVSVKGLQGTAIRKSERAKEEASSQIQAAALKRLARDVKLKPEADETIVGGDHVKGPAMELPEQPVQDGIRMISRATEVSGSRQSSEERVVEETISEEYLEPSVDGGRFRRPRRVTKRKQLLRTYSRDSPFVADGSAQEALRHADKYQEKGSVSPTFEGSDILHEAYEDHAVSSNAVDPTRCLRGSSQAHLARRWRRKVESSSLEKFPSSEDINFRKRPRGSIADGDRRKHLQAPIRSTQLWNREVETSSLEKRPSVRETYEEHAQKREGRSAEWEDTLASGTERRSELLGNGYSSSLQCYESPLHIRVCCRTLPFVLENEQKGATREGDYPDQLALNWAPFDEDSVRDRESTDEEPPIQSWRTRSKSLRDASIHPKHISRADAWADVNTWLDMRGPHPVSQAKVTDRAVRRPSPGVSESELVSIAVAKREQIDLHTPKRKSDVRPMLSTMRRTEDRARSISRATTSPVRRLITTLRRMRKERYPMLQIVPQPNYPALCQSHERLERFDPKGPPVVREGICGTHEWYDPEKKQLRRMLSHQELLHEIEIEELLRDVEREELLCDLAKGQLELDTIHAVKRSKPEQAAKFAAVPSKPSKGKSYTTTKKKQRCSDAGLKLMSSTLRQGTPKSSPRHTGKWFAWSATPAKREGATRIPTMAYHDAVTANTSFIWRAPSSPFDLASTARQPLEKQRPSQAKVPSTGSSAAYRSPSLRSPQSSLALGTPRATNGVSAREWQYAFSPAKGLAARPRSQPLLLRPSLSRTFTASITPLSRHWAERDDIFHGEQRKRSGRGDPLNVSAGRFISENGNSSLQKDVYTQNILPTDLNAPQPLSGNKNSFKKRVASLASLRGADTRNNSRCLTCENAGDALRKTSTRLLKSSLSEDDRRSNIRSEGSTRTMVTTLSEGAVTVKVPEELPKAGPPDASAISVVSIKPRLSHSDQQPEAKISSKLSAESAKSEIHVSSGMVSTKCPQKLESEQNFRTRADEETGITEVAVEIPSAIKKKQQIDLLPELPVAPHVIPAEQQVWNLTGNSVKLFPESELVLLISLLCVIWIVGFGFTTSRYSDDVHVVRTKTAWSALSTVSSQRDVSMDGSSTVKSRLKLTHLCDSEYCRKEGVYLDHLLGDKEPCDNFYEYVCETWIQNAARPPVDALWEVSSDTAIQYDIETRTMRYIRDPLNSVSVKPAGELYKACMNRVKVGSSGIHYARQMFDTWRIKKWPLLQPVNSQADDVWIFAGELTRDLGLNVLVTTAVVTHPSDRRRSIAALDKPEVLLIDEDMSVPQLMELVRLAIEETASQFGVHDTFALYSDIISVFSTLSAAVGLTQGKEQIFKVVTVLDVNDGFQPLLSEVFDGITNVDHSTQLLLVSPDFIENRLEYILRVETPRALLNYLGFRALIFLAPFLHQSLRHLEKLFSLQVFGRIVPSKRSSFCLRATERVLPACVLRAYTQSHMKSTMTYRLWLSQLEDIFLRNIGDIAWFDEITGLLLRYKLKHTYVEAFFSDEILNGSIPCGPNYTVSTWDSPLKVYHDLSQRRQRELLEGASGHGVWKSGLSGLFQTAATYDLLRQMVRVPVGVLNISVPSNETVFDFHNSRMAVRIYSALINILFEGTAYEMETPLEFTEGAERLLRSLLNCFAIEFATLPASLQDGSHAVVENINWIRHSLLGHTVALGMAFRAFRDLLHIRRVWRLDFRLSTLPDVSADQLFFVYYALDNCEYSDWNRKRQAYRKMQKIPPADRVNIALRHTGAFHTAFQCERGRAMKAPEPTMCVVLKERKGRRWG